MSEPGALLMAAAMIVASAAFMLGAVLVFGFHALREHRLSLDARRRLIEAETDRLRAERLLARR